MGEARAWKLVLGIYVVNVGQKINFDKRKVFFFNTPPILQWIIVNILACNIVELPDTYPGLPLTMKDVSNNIWNDILERMEKKLIKWKSKTLSSMGKLQVLISSLQGLLVYFLSLFKYG